MLGSAGTLAATATVYPDTTPASPTRPSRLRGLSYLRSYTRDNLLLHAPRAIAQPLTRSASSPTGPTFHDSPAQTSASRDSGPAVTATASSTIQSAENGWIPTIQGRSVLSRESANPTSTSTASVFSADRDAAGMTRSRAATSLVPSATPLPHRPSVSGPLSQSIPPNMAEPTSSTSSLQPPPPPPSSLPPSIRFIPHVENRANRPSLNFAAVSRTLKTTDGVVRVGRFSERDNSLADPPVGFKSKVVSRRHCEFWCTEGQWYIKDVKSSSGTFLNHVRLSSPGQESKPYAINDGDVVQLGIDFKGGEEVIFRCVKIRVECNRDWQKGLNNFNTSAHKRLFHNHTTRAKYAKSNKNRDSDAGSVSSSECSICLNPVAPCQALFVAPCSHVWHFKCIRNLLQGPLSPNFLCPNCRFVADLDADVEPPEDLDYDEEDMMEGENMISTNGRSASHGSSNEALRHSSHEDFHRLHHDGANDLARILPDPFADAAHGGRSPLHDAHMSDRPSRASLHPDDSVPRASREASASLAAAHGDDRSSSRAVNVASRGSRAPSSDRLNGRSTTPTSTAQFALAVGPAADGPMTPRNDAGPFVLDGSGRRPSGNHPSGQDPSDDAFDEASLII